MDRLIRLGSTLGRYAEYDNIDFHKPYNKVWFDDLDGHLGLGSV